MYAQGITTPGKIVANAEGGQSNHNFGIAWDVGIFNNGNYSQQDTDYNALAAVILPQLNAIEWGGTGTL